MNINLNWELDSTDLMKGIRFNRETYKDEVSCENIIELSEILSDIVFQLGQVRYDTLQEPENASGKQIRKEIDRLIKGLEVQIDEVKSE